MVVGRMYQETRNGTYFFEGQANVYDRIIDPQGNYCVGQVGNGYRKCVDQNGDVMNGLWKNGTFMGRPQKYDEIVLEELLSKIENPPPFVNASALSKFNELGALDYKQLIDQGKLSFKS
jgi:hypothetical protein